MNKNDELFVFDYNDKKIKKFSKLSTKIDLNVYDWVIDAPGYVSQYGISSDSQGNLVASGFYVNKLTVPGCGQYNAGSGDGTTDISLVKFDSINGVRMWAKNFGAPGKNDAAWGVAIDANSARVALTGYSDADPIKFDEMNRISSQIAPSDYFLAVLHPPVPLETSSPCDPPPIR